MDIFSGFIKQLVFCLLGTFVYLPSMDNLEPNMHEIGLERNWNTCRKPMQVFLHTERLQPVFKPLSCLLWDDGVKHSTTYLSSMVPQISLSFFSLLPQFPSHTNIIFSFSGSFRDPLSLHVLPCPLFPLMADACPSFSLVQPEVWIFKRSVKREFFLLAVGDHCLKFMKFTLQYKLK